jgi:hypothetical protein
LDQNLDKYYNHIYRNSAASFVPDVVPKFKSKAEIDAWFYELERKDVLFAEYAKNLKDLEAKEQAAIDALVNATKDSLEEVSLEEAASDEVALEDIENTFPVQ